MKSLKTVLNRSTLLALMAVGMVATPARATLAIKVTDAAGTQTSSTAGPALAFTTSDSIFDIILSIATSNSPGGPATLTIDATVRTNGSPSPSLPQDITIEVSSDGFLSPTGLAFLTQHVNTNRPELDTVTGGANFQGFAKTNGALFDETGLATSLVNLPDYNLRSGTSTSASSLFVSPYTLTEKIVMHFTSGGQGQATANLAVVTVPEPTTITLLGGVLLCTVGVIRRKARRA